MEVRWYKNSNVSSSLPHEIQKQKNDDSRKNKRVDTTEKRNRFCCLEDNGDYLIKGAYACTKAML